MSAKSGDEWEALGREVAAWHLDSKLDALSLATGTLEQIIREEKDPTRGDIQQFRNALADLQTIVEKDLTAVAEGEIEPYDKALLHVQNQTLVEHATGFQDRE